MSAERKRRCPEKMNPEIMGNKLPELKFAGRCENCVKREMNGNRIIEKIKELWDKRGWRWDSHAGDASKRLLGILPEILADEINSISNDLRLISESLECSAFQTMAGKEYFMLYKKLKEAGADEETASYAVYAFLAAGHGIERPVININKNNEHQ